METRLCVKVTRDQYSVRYSQVQYYGVVDLPEHKIVLYLELSPKWHSNSRVQPRPASTYPRRNASCLRNKAITEGLLSPA